MWISVVKSVSAKDICARDENIAEIMRSLKKEDLSFSNLIKLINVKKQTMTLILKDLENSSHIIKIDNSK